MFQSCATLLLILPLGQPSETQKEQFTGPLLRGRVLDFFDGDLVLVALGADQGVRKGQKGLICWTEATPRHYSQFEFVKVGTKHSVVRVRLAIELYSTSFDKQDTRVQRNEQIIKTDDTIVFYTYSTGAVPRLTPQVPAYMQPGGAIIDLTKPRK